MKMAEITELAAARAAYCDALDWLTRTLSISSVTLYFAGHQSRDVGATMPALRDRLKEAAITHAAAQVHDALSTLELLGVDVREERDALEKQLKENDE